MSLEIPSSRARAEKRMTSHAVAGTGTGTVGGAAAALILMLGAASFTDCLSFSILTPSLQSSSSSARQRALFSAAPDAATSGHQASVARLSKAGERNSLGLATASSSSSSTDRNSTIGNLALGLNLGLALASLRPAAAAASLSRHSRGAIASLRAGDASLTSKVGARTQYIVGITWYLGHFLVGIANDSIMKYLGGSLPAMQIVFLRFLAAALVMAPLVAREAVSKNPATPGTGRKSSSPSSTPLILHLARGFLLAVGIGLWCSGLQLLPFASCVVVNNTMPFFKMAFASTILGENVAKERWLASIGGFIGCLLIFNPSAATFNPTSLVLLLSAACFAMLDILNKKYATSESMVSMLFYGSLATAFWALPLACLSWVPLTCPQLALFGALGFGANVLLFCLLKALQLVDASATCPYRYTEFVLSAASGLLIFGESPPTSTLLGSAIILPSVIYCALAECRQAKE